MTTEPADVASEDPTVTGGIFLGVITAGEVRVETCRSILLAGTTPNTPITHSYLHVHGPYLDDARNKVVEKFLQSPCSHLLFVDSDIEFTIDDIHILTTAMANLDDGECVVGGVYYSGSIVAPKAPVVYDADMTLTAVDGGPFTQLDYEDPRILSGQPFLTGCVGTGFMLIPRTVLDKMIPEYNYPQPWFAEETVNDTHMGEDMTFCLRLAAMGIHTYAVPAVTIKHFKTSRY